MHVGFCAVSITADGWENEPMGKGIRYEERLDHENRCTARNRAGKPCGAYAVRGGRVCRVHGGPPQVIAAAKRRLAVMAERQQDG